MAVLGGLVGLGARRAFVGRAVVVVVGGFGLFGPGDRPVVAFVRRLAPPPPPPREARPPELAPQHKARVQAVVWTPVGVQYKGGSHLPHPPRSQATGNSPPPPTARPAPTALPPPLSSTLQALKKVKPTHLWWRL